MFDRKSYASEELQQQSSVDGEAFEVISMIKLKLTQFVVVRSDSKYFLDRHFFLSHFGFPFKDFLCGTFLYGKLIRVDFLNSQGLDGFG